MTCWTPLGTIRIRVAGLVLCALAATVAAPAVHAAAPTVTDPIDAYSVDEDAAPSVFDLDVSFSDPDGDALTYSAVAAAAGVDVSVDGSTLTVTYAANFSGQRLITVTATEDTGEGASAQFSFTVTVDPVDDAPVLSAPLADLIVAEDSGPVVVSLAGVFTDVDTLFEGDQWDDVEVQGAGAFITALDASADSLKVTLEPNGHGESDITVTVVDGAAKVSDTFTVTVTPVPDEPIVENPLGSLTLDEDAQAVSIDLAAVFGDADVETDGEALTYGVTAPDAALALFDTLAVAGSVLTIDLAADVFDEGGVPITVSATDSQPATAEDVLTLMIHRVFPVAVDDAATVAEDGSGVVVAVLANDQQGDPDTRIVQFGVDEGIYTHVSETEWTTGFDEAGQEVTEPNGVLTLVDGTSILYAPKANYNGTDHFTYTIEDGDGERSTATVTVTVRPSDDPPRVVGTPQYTVNQGAFLEIGPSEGVLSWVVDDDHDALRVILVAPPDSSTIVARGFSISPDGSFALTPAPDYGDDPDEGPITFQVVYWDEDDRRLNVGGPVTVTVYVDPIEAVIPSAPPGEVQEDFNLADLPLENAVAVEANVLLIVDDSGSMDWGTMTNEPDGVMTLANTNVAQPGVLNFPRRYYYLYPLETNINQGTNSVNYVLPTEEGLADTPEVEGNDYGVWRARNHQFNTIYYNPGIRYQPWTGLARHGEPFADADPASALLDPFDVDSQTIDLTRTHTFSTLAVPAVRLLGPGSPNRWVEVVNSNVYFPYYYTTSASGRPAWNDPHEKVEISDAQTVYPGGPNREDCAVGDGDPLTCTYDQELRNFANWFTYYRSREYTAKAALGRSIADAGNLRMGYAVLNQEAQRLPIASLNGSFRSGHKKDLMDQVYQTPSNGTTPLLEALDKAGRHFECVAGDSFGSTSSSNPGQAGCPILPPPDGQCQNNFALLFSDGEWNDDLNPSNPAAADHDSDSGPTASLFDGGKFGASESNTLADVAMYYYERDLHDLPDGVPTTPRDRANAPIDAFSAQGRVMHQHMKTYTVGFGVEGTVTEDDLPDDYLEPFPWTDPRDGGEAKIDDMLHAAVNGRGQFLQANNPVLLSAAFQKAFAEFAAGSLSVSAVTFSSTTLREDTVVFNGTFNLADNTGDLLAVRIDPDTGRIVDESPVWSAADELDRVLPDNRVIVTYDRRAGAGIPFRYDSLNLDQLVMMSQPEVDFMRGVRSTEQPVGVLRARDEAGGLLGDIVHSGPRYVGPPRALRRNQAPYPTSTGDLYVEFRDSHADRRRVVYVGANDGMLHGFDAGTSASDVGTGRELLAYVPGVFMDTSQRFASELDDLTTPDYRHRFYVDVTPETEDVFMLPNDGATHRTWNTVLVGALGAGGKGLFALNVTDPDAFANESVAADTVLWEFTAADDTTTTNGQGETILDPAGLPVKDLGYTFGEPQVAMTNAEDDTGNKRWAVFAGNGYNSTAGVAKLFALFLEGGLNGTWSEWSGGTGDFIKIDTGSGVKLGDDPQAGFPNGLGPPALVDVDRDGTVDRVYAGDWFGTLYRFDVSSTSPSEWSVTPIFNATYDETTNTRQPITTRPVVFFNDPTGYLVIVATGSYMRDEDSINSDIQSVYGIWDRDEVVPATLASDAKSTLLVEQPLTNRVDESFGVRGNLRVPSNNEVRYTPSTPSEDGVYGWYLDFDMPRAQTTQQGNPNQDTSGSATGAQYPGERAIRRILVLGDTIVLTTVIPRTENSCLRAPPGAIIPLYWRDGSAPDAPVLDLQNDGVVDANDNVLGGGAGFLLPPETCVGADCAETAAVVSSNVALITDGSEGKICTSAECITIEVLLKRRTGRLSWRELPRLVE